MAWKTILDEGLKLFDVKDGHDDKYKRLLKSSLDIVGEAIQSSDIKDPLQFFQSTAHGGKITDPLLFSVVVQIRPIAAMYLCELRIDYCNSVYSSCNTLPHTRTFSCNPSMGCSTHHHTTITHKLQRNNKLLVLDQ